VCPSWTTSAVVTTPAGAAQRDRTDAQQDAATTRITKDVESQPSQQLQPKFGAGARGGGRSTV
jgi:hypothetical protein